MDRKLFLSCLITAIITWLCTTLLQSEDQNVINQLRDQNHKLHQQLTHASSQHINDVPKKQKPQPSKEANKVSKGIENQKASANTPSSDKQSLTPPEKFDATLVQRAKENGLPPEVQKEFDTIYKRVGRGSIYKSGDHFTKLYAKHDLKKALLEKARQPLKRTIHGGGQRNTFQADIAEYPQPQNMYQDLMKLVDDTSLNIDNREFALEALGALKLEGFENDTRNAFVLQYLRSSPRFTQAALRALARIRQPHLISADDINQIIDKNYPLNEKNVRTRSQLYSLRDAVALINQQ